MPALELTPADTVKVAALVATFHRTLERQRQHDAATLASVVRALKRGGPDAEQFCQLINHRVLHACSTAAGNGTDARDEEP